MLTEAATEEKVRAGSRVLEIFENPLNARILRAHVKGPQRLGDLREEVAWSAETTLRTAVVGLCEIGALEKRAVKRSPYAVATFLTPVGEEMLEVADVVEAWLGRCPGGPIPPGSPEAKVAVKALAGGWSSTLMRVLANGPFTLTELDRLIPEMSYPALERRLSWMRSTGQIEPAEKEGRGTPYVVTDWLRHAIAPLCMAGRCERRHLSDDSGPITSIEVEAAFLLTMSLAHLPPVASGSCTLGVQVPPLHLDSGEASLAGVSVMVEAGRITSIASRTTGPPTTWALGSPDVWLDAVIDGDIAGLRAGGIDPQLAVDLVHGVHYALFTDR